jgi:hypothetical protein
MKKLRLINQLNNKNQLQQSYKNLKALPEMVKIEINLFPQEAKAQQFYHSLKFQSSMGKLISTYRHYYQRVNSKILLLAR